MNTALRDGKYVKMARAVFSTGAAFVINYLIQLVLTPFITGTVGAEAYGFVSLAKNFAQYAAILTAALNSFAARYIAVSYHEHEIDRANTFFSSVFWGDMVLGTGLLLLSIPVISLLERFLNIPPAIVADVKHLFFYVFLNFWLTTLGCAFESAAFIKSKLDLTGLFKGLSYLAEALFLFAFYRFLPVSVSYVGAGMIVASVVVVIGNILICKKETPELSIRLSHFSWEAVGKLVLNGVWTSVNNLGEILNNGLDLIICNLMLTPLAMGQLAIAKTVHTMFHGMFVILNPAFQPMLLKSYAENDRATLLDELKLAMKISGFAGNIAFAGFAALGLAFYRLWIPGQDIRLIYELTLISCITFIPGGPMQPLYFIYTLTVRRKVPCLITLAGGILNVLSTWLLIRHTGLGVHAVVWTTAVLMMVINFGTNPLYMAHVLGLPRFVFYPGILRNLLSCTCMTGLFWALTKLCAPSGWVSLALCAVFYAVLGMILHTLIVFDRGSLRLLLGRLRKKGVK